jgi:prophage DNA circulation protein
MAEQFPASIDGIPFDCEDLEDSFEKTIARYEFPYRDGALLEDMGQKARTVRIRCYFLNEAYERHKELVNRLKSPSGDFELVHPLYGILKGQVESIVVHHDRREQTAEIDLTFLEQFRGTLEVQHRPSVDGGTEEAFQAGQDELTDSLSNDIAEELGADSGPILQDTLDPDRSLLDQFDELSAKARVYVKEADRYVRRLKKTLNEITSPANSLVSTISYATNLPGIVIGSLAGAVERYALLYGSLMTSPTRFLNSLAAGVADLETAFDRFGKYTKIAKAQRIAVELGSALKADQVKSRAQQRAASVKTFSALGRLQKPIEPAEAVLTVSEIEVALAIAREVLQGAVELDRTMQSTKDLAAILTDHVVEIKKERPAIMQVSLDNALPLHLVCLKYGLSYQDAELLMGINRIRRPNFVTGKVNVYVR